MIHRITIIAIIFCLLLASCSLYSDKKAIPDGYSKLTVIVEDSSTFYLDKVSVRNSNAGFKLINDYDTIKKQYIYVYDSLKNNEYEVVLSSLLNRAFRMPITLIKDTTIFISRDQLPNYDTISDVTNLLSVLNGKDTICIGYTSISCFHNRSYRTLIYKNDGGYMAEFTTDTSQDYNIQQIVSIKRQLDPTFSDTLKKLELACGEGLAKQLKIKRHIEKELRNAKTSNDSFIAGARLYWNTTSSVIYINRGNKVFELTNSYINEIPYFDKFINALRLE